MVRNTLWGRRVHGSKKADGEACNNDPSERLSGSAEKQPVTRCIFKARRKSKITHMRFLMD